ALGGRILGAHRLVAAMMMEPRLSAIRVTCDEVAMQALDLPRLIPACDHSQACGSEDEGAKTRLKLF
ncbi:MAG: hypothetical protein AAFO01_21885, partial [Pseudomonadota bacterium]